MAAAALLATMTHWPSTQALPVCVVSVFAPVPTARLVVLVPCVPGALMAVSAAALAVAALAAAATRCASAAVASWSASTALL